MFIFHHSQPLLSTKGCPAATLLVLLGGTRIAWTGIFIFVSVLIDSPALWGLKEVGHRAIMSPGRTKKRGRPVSSWMILSPMSRWAMTAVVAAGVLSRLPGGEAVSGPSLGVSIGCAAPVLLLSASCAFSLAYHGVRARRALLLRCARDFSRRVVVLPIIVSSLSSISESSLVVTSYVAPGTHLQ